MADFTLVETVQLGTYQAFSASSYSTMGPLINCFLAEESVGKSGCLITVSELENSITFDSRIARNQSMAVPN